MYSVMPVDVNSYIFPLRNINVFGYSFWEAVYTQVLANVFV